jgi:hypothetical protein
LYGLSTAPYSSNDTGVFHHWLVAGW